MVGEILFQGVQFLIDQFNSSSEFLLPLEKQFDVRITDPVPLLDLSIESNIISLFNGEKTAIKTIIKNSGNIVISKIQFHIINSSQCHIQYDENIIKKSL